METGPSTVELDRAFRGHRGPVTCLAFHPDEQQVVSGSQDGSLFVWHFKPQLRPFRFMGHKGEVHDVVMSHTGQTIASASADQTVRLWSNSAQGESRVMKVHCGAVRSVCFSRDDSLLLTASDDKTIKLWSLSTYRFHASLVEHTNWVYSADFSKNSELVASGGEDKVVRIWDVEKKASIMTFPDFEVPVTKVKFHPDGSSVAACGKDGCIKLWDLRSRKLLQHYDAHRGAIASIDFHPTGEQLMSAGEDGLRIWNLREGRLMHEVSGLKKSPTACAFAPSGRGPGPSRDAAVGLLSLAAGSRDNLVLTWNFKPSLPEKGRHPVSTPERATAPKRDTAKARAPPAPSPAPAPEAALPEKVEVEEPEVPQHLTETLKTMQSHLEIMVRTVQLLDQRLALNEEQVKAMRSELLQQNAAVEPKVSIPEVGPRSQQRSSPREVKSGLTTQEEELQRELENLKQLL